MKHLIPLLLLFAIAQAQPYAGIGITNKGRNISVGYSNVVDIQAAIRGSRSSETPMVASFSIGLPLYVGEIVITPAAGYGYYTRQDFSQYDAPPYKITTDKGYAPYGAIEIGWERTKSDGSLTGMRLFATAQYCKVAAFGVGIKGFIR